MKRIVLILTVPLFSVLVNFCLSDANDNLIYGCYKKNNGQLRIVNPSTKCLSSEIPISWSQGGSPTPVAPSAPQAPADGPMVTFRQVNPVTFCTNEYGWCPNGFTKWTFRIQEPVVNENSIVAINVINPNMDDHGCEVATKGAGEFLIICLGEDYVSGRTALHYAVFNP